MTETLAASTASPTQLIRMTDGLVIHQALYVAAALRIADLLDGKAGAVSDLAAHTQVNEDALYRILRVLASQGVFEETTARTFVNTDLSLYLRESVPGSLHGYFMFRGSDFYLPPYEQILYSVRTGLPARELLYGANAFDYFKQHPEIARTFDNGMTSMSMASGPGIANAYDFGSWGTLMDMGGGSGILLACILRVHPRLRGVLADLPQVLDRARERGYLGGDLQLRTEFRPINFFEQVPDGCRAYLMRNVIHDWDDERAHRILTNCRCAVPPDGALLLVEYLVADGNQFSAGKVVDVSMLVLTGGKERTEAEYRELLARAGFRLNRVVQAPGDHVILEALPV